MQEIVTRVRGMCIESMKMKAKRKLNSESIAKGPKAKSSWMERISEFALDITSPLAVRSKKENDSFVRCLKINDLSWVSIRYAVLNSKNL